MPSVKNPNAPSKNRLAARAAKQRKASHQALAQTRLARTGGSIAKADARRGARPGLLPTSGPRAAVSKKRARRDEKRIAHALRRKREAEEGVEGEMKGKFLKG